ncbi:unnamed protein product [Spirodela intermedia]|uniref:SCP domain-containing protein n=1 Tax=Spirodela intermedia TaxID=51605 RepID=A0A7I8KX34_SPIIN|nr:unnamed protein product [Spirodela intermedia]
MGHAALLRTTIRFLIVACFISHVAAHIAGGGATSPETVAAFLSPQNAVRVRHGVPPLRWSAALAMVAGAYAEQRRADCALVHSTNDYGENLFWGQGRLWTPSDAVAAWTAEEASYDYANNVCDPAADCSHYTQLLWRWTKNVGCDKVFCASGDSFIICNYYPHGNVVGQRPY